VWLTTAVDDSGGVSLQVLAFDAATGKEVVNVEAFLIGGAYLKNIKNSHASPTPIVEGDRVLSPAPRRRLSPNRSPHPMACQQTPQPLHRIKSPWC
jgi:hypothetical protein